MSHHRTDSLKSGTSKSFTSVNIMDVPTYDNGLADDPRPKVSNVPVRRPLIQAPTRVTSQQVKFGAVKPKTASSRPSHPAVSKIPQPSNRSGYIPPSNIPKYINKPLPPIPKSASSASRPKGVTKPQGLPQYTIPRKPVPPPASSTHYVNKPLPPLPLQINKGKQPLPPPNHPQPHPQPKQQPKPQAPPTTSSSNGIFTRTGQYVNPHRNETSAFSATTVSTTRTAAARQKKKELAAKLKPYGHEILANARVGQVTQVPDISLKSSLNAHHHSRGGAGGRNMVPGSSYLATPRPTTSGSNNKKSGFHWGIGSSSTNNSNKNDKEASRKRMESVRKIIHGTKRVVVENTNEWKSCTLEERILLKREIDEVSIRRFYGGDKLVAGKVKGGKGKEEKEKGCVVM